MTVRDFQALYEKTLLCENREVAEFVCVNACQKIRNALWKRDVREAAMELADKFERHYDTLS